MNDEATTRIGSSTWCLGFRDYKINYCNLMILPSFVSGPRYLQKKAGSEFKQLKTH
jgi:hypothetical protein